MGHKHKRTFWAEDSVQPPARIGRGTKQWPQKLPRD